MTRPVATFSVTRKWREIVWNGYCPVIRSREVTATHYGKLENAQQACAEASELLGWTPRRIWHIHRWFGG